MYYRKIVSKIPSNVFAFISLTVITLIIFIFNSPYTDEPNVDGEVFRNIGMHITKGYLPYRDIFDHKGPGVYYIAALVHPLGIWGNWLFSALCASYAAFLLFKVSEHFSLTHKWFIPVAFLFSLIWQRELYGRYVDTRFFTTVLLVIMLYLITVKKDGHYFLKGFLGGMIFLTHQNEILPYVILSIFNIFSNAKTIKKIINIGLRYITGFCVLPLILVAYYIWHNALYDLYFGVIYFNKTYFIRSISLAEHIDGLDYLFKKSFLPKFFICCSLCFVFSIILNKNRAKQKNLILLTIAISSVAIFNIMLSGYYLLYYTFHLILPCVLLILITVLNISYITKVKLQPISFTLFATSILLLLTVRRSIWVNMYETFTKFKFHETMYTSKYKDIIYELEKVDSGKQTIYLLNATPALAVSNKLNIVSPSKWALNYFWTTVSQEIQHFDTSGIVFQTEIINPLRIKKPTLIISNDDFRTPPLLKPNINIMWRNFIDSNYNLLKLCEAHPEFIIYKLK